MLFKYATLLLEDTHMTIRCALRVFLFPFLFVYIDAAHAAKTSSDVTTAPGSAITTTPLQKGDIVAGTLRDAALKVLGTPDGSVVDGTRETLIYDKGDVLLEGGAVVALHVDSYAVRMSATAASGSAVQTAGDGAEKKPWYAALTGMFKSKPKVEAPPVKTVADLAPRYTSSAMIRWKVQILDADTPNANIRMEGPEGSVDNQHGFRFVDIGGLCRISGNQLEVEYLNYDTKDKKTWVKLFTIIDRNTLKCNDPKLFPGEMIAEDSIKKRKK
jgi:hypothetical protein